MTEDSIAVAVFYILKCTLALNNKTLHSQTHKKATLSQLMALFTHKIRDRPFDYAYIC